MRTKLKLKGKLLASEALLLSKEQQQEKMKLISADINIRYAVAFRTLDGHPTLPGHSVDSRAKS